MTPFHFPTGRMSDEEMAENAAQARIDFAEASDEELELQGLSRPNYAALGMPTPGYHDAGGEKGRRRLMVTSVLDGDTDVGPATEEQINESDRTASKGEFGLFRLDDGRTAWVTEGVDPAYEEHQQNLRDREAAGPRDWRDLDSSQ